MDPASIIGLTASALALLELAIKTISVIAQLAKKYRDAAEDMEMAEWWLSRHKVTLSIWIDFWAIKGSAGDCMSVLWGPEGKATITGHLQSLRNLTEKATELQKRYSSELIRFSEKRRLKFLKKARFVFSGKTDFESVNESIRVQLETLQSDAKTMFLQEHPFFNPGELSGTAIKTVVQEIREIDTVLYVQKVSSRVFDALAVSGIAEMDLKLRPGFTGKETFTLTTSEAVLEHSVKLPLSFSIRQLGNGRKDSDNFTLVSTADQKLCTVVEFDDTSEHPGLDPRIEKRNPKELQAITHLFQASIPQFPHTDTAPYVYHLSPEIGSPKLIFHDMCVDESEHFNQNYMQIPKQPLATFFKELQTLGGTDAFQKFPIRDRLELAYLLAVTVMNLHGTEWLTKLCSNHVSWGKEDYGAKKHCSLKVLSQDMCENTRETTPFDIFRPSALEISTNVFSLGLLLHEIGTGQLIQKTEPNDQLKWRPAWHADRLLLQTGNIISNTYASVVAACLKGDFETTTRKDFLSSYFARVIQP